MEAAGIQLESVETWSGKARTAENFPVGSVLISRALRPHVHAFYDFARNADDIADSAALDPAEKLARLDVMEAVLLGARAGGSPSAAALRDSLAETGVTPVHARELLRAFRQDALKPHYECWHELADYCRYSAMPVGRYVLDLHGESRELWPASDALCSSLQILNHLQDGSKDLAALGRCYLPREWLDAEGASARQLLAAAASPGLRRVFGRLLDRCEAMNAAAWALPRGVRGRRLRLETAVIVGLAERLARRLRHRDPVAVRVKLRPRDVVLALAGALTHA